MRGKITLEQALLTIGEAIKENPAATGEKIGKMIAPHATGLLPSLSGLLGDVTVQVTWTPLRPNLMPLAGPTMVRPLPTYPDGQATAAPLSFQFSSGPSSEARPSAKETNE